MRDLNPIVFRTCLALCTWLVSMPLSAQPMLHAPAASDLTAAAVQPVARATRGVELERSAIDYYQPLDPAIALDMAPAPARAESREYWQQVDAAALADGYSLALTSPGAVVLLSPAIGAEPLQRTQAAIVDSGRALALETAADTLVGADELHAAGLDVQPGSLGFRLRPGFEKDAVLRVAGARGNYLLHVFEPGSRHVATARAHADIVHAGGTVAVEVSLEGGATVSGLTGLLLAPDGQSFDLAFAQNGGDRATGRAVVPVGVVTSPGLWDVRTSIAGRQGDTVFQRDVRTAVAVVTPTARIVSARESKLQRAGQGPALAFDLEVASAGRYELRGTLFGVDASGNAVPVGIAFAARWLEPGQRQIPLAFPASVRAAASTPWTLRDLRLTDQSRVAVIERRATALSID